MYLGDIINILPHYYYALHYYYVAESDTENRINKIRTAFKQVKNAWNTNKTQLRIIWNNVKAQSWEMMIELEKVLIFVYKEFKNMPGGQKSF